MTQVHINFIGDPASGKSTVMRFLTRGLEALGVTVVMVDSRRDDRHGLIVDLDGDDLATIRSDLKPSTERPSLEAHFAQMQDMMRRYIEPATYIATFPKDGTKWESEFAEANRSHQSAEGARNTKDRRDAAFISDMIRMMDGPEQRTLQTAIAAITAK